MVNRDARSEAEQLAREAVGLVPLEMPNLQTDLLMDIADMLRMTGNQSEASPRIVDAINLYENKGNLVSADRARSLPN
jgi:hypothetical protein